jgi:hypothetical protein
MAALRNDYYPRFVQTSGPVGGARLPSVREGCDMPVNGNEPELSWQADAPVFIDGQQIGAFYDAIVGREFKAVQLQLSAGQTEQLERSAVGSVNAGLSPLFPWLKIDAGVQAGKTRSRGRQAGQSIVLGSKAPRCGWCS